MKEIFTEWNESLAGVGIKPLSDDTCCRLLAVVYVFGGEREAFTHNARLLADTRHAQKRLRLSGGEAPDAELVPVMNRYIAELEHAVDIAKTPETVRFLFEKDWNCWAVEFMQTKYGIKL